MEITRSNYRQQLSHLQQVINDAQFFAIDTEFTGLNFHDSITPFDTPAEFYAKIQENTQGYVIIQFGITAFSVVAEGDDDCDAGAPSKPEHPAAAAKPRFRYESFNFYVCPSSRKQTFRCQGESMAFLGTHNFDFNKLFREGISYCDLIEANEVRQKMSEKTPNDCKTYAGESTLVVPKEELEMIANIRQSVNEFLASDEKEITIEHCNAFRRKLVYQLLEQEFANKVFASPRKLTNSSIKVIVIQRKKTNSEEKQYFADKLEQEWAEMEDYIGFTTILKQLSDSKKLIVGHNMFLDVLYTMRQFIAPETSLLSDFKRVTHKMFPALLDTKYLCSQDSLKKKIPSSALGDIFECMSKKPFVMPDIQPVKGGFSYKNVEGQMHDAGYDSYMTGVSFISMALHLNIAPSELHSRSPKLKNLINKLFILRLADVWYIDLTGKEPQPNHDHVFYVTVPDHWKHPNVAQQFRNYGNVNSSWLSSNVCYVALQQREHASVVMPTIRLVEGVTVTPFAVHRARQQLEQATLSARPSAEANTTQHTNAGDSCRIPIKRKSNSGHDDTPTTRVAVNDNDKVAAAAATSNALDDDANASECKPEQKLTKKMKLKQQRTEQAVFQVNDDWN